MQLLASVRRHLQRVGGEDEEREDNNDIVKAEAIEGIRETYHGRDSPFLHKAFSNRCGGAGSIGREACSKYIHENFRGP